MPSAVSDIVTAVLSPDQGELWSAAKENLAARLPAGDFKIWIEPLKISAIEDGRLILAGPNNFFIERVQAQFSGDLSAALSAAGFNLSAPLEFVADLSLPGETGPTRPESGAEPPSGQGPAQRPLGFGDRFTLENFVVGDSNLLAYSAVKTLAGGGDLGADALFITSDHGLGKSHLSLALGRSLSRKSQVYYLTAENFTNEMTHALRHGLMDDFKAKYRQMCDLLVLEEVQFLAGKEKIQAELCFTLDCLMEKGKKVVFTSPQEPRGIPRLGRSLRSRLTSALVSPIGSPDYETRLNILVKKARAGDLKVPRPVLEYLAERATSDIRRLESCLMSLRARSRLLGRRIDLALARETLAHLFDEGSEEGLSLLGVRSLICRYFNLETAEITSRSRSARLNEARAAGIYLARQLTGRTLSEIGLAFGRTHSSALYACNKLEERLKKDPKLAGRLDLLRQRLSQD